MQTRILNLSGQSTVADIAAAAYNLKPNDPALATAQKNLIAANPALSGNLATLPKNTVVVVPPLSGVAAAGTTTVNVDPHGGAFHARLGNLFNAASAAAAQRSGATTATVPLGTAPGATTTSAPLAQLDFSALRSDLATFIKLHGG